MYALNTVTKNRNHGTNDNNMLPGYSNGIKLWNMFYAKNQ